MPTRILFLFSDTGGGHRSAAQAIHEAIDLYWPGRGEVILADFYTDAFPPPLNRTGALYGPMVNKADCTWYLSWKAGEYRLVRDPLWRALMPTMKGRFVRLIQSHDPDVVVSVHPLASTPMAVAAAALPRPLPALTVVTDLVDGSATWYDQDVNFTYVPTEPAMAKGLRLGIEPGRIEVVGQPVSPRFQPFMGDRAALRRRLGLHPDTTTIIIVGGGEGMGKVYDTAVALDASELDVQLAVIAGRNAALKEELDAYSWSAPTVTTGFVRNMPEWMAASDVIVTKAGPGTIAEALIEGLPMILSGYVPGQEKANVDFVVSEGVGAAAFAPEAVVETLRDWLRPGSLALDEMKARCLALAKPNAARDLGERILIWGERSRRERGLPITTSME